MRRGVVPIIVIVFLVIVIVAGLFIIFHRDNPTYLTVKVDGFNYDSYHDVTTIYFAGQSMIFRRNYTFELGKTYTIEYYSYIWDFFSGWKTIVKVTEVG
jgi:hypothetical protein